MFGATAANSTAAVEASRIPSQTTLQNPDDVESDREKSQNNHDDQDVFEDSHSSAGSAQSLRTYFGGLRHRMAEATRTCWRFSPALRRSRR
jgi:hypothetical protein